MDNEIKPEVVEHDFTNGVVKAEPTESMINEVVGDGEVIEILED